MKCSEVRRMIPGWLGGELDAAGARKVQKHIEACPACRREMEFWQEINATLQEGAGGMQAPEGFTAGVMAQLEEQQPRRAGFFAQWKRGVAAAAVFLLAVAGAAGFYLGTDPSSTTGPVAREGGKQPAAVAENEPGTGEEPGTPGEPGTGQDSDTTPGGQPEGDSKDTGTGPDNNPEQPANDKQDGSTAGNDSGDKPDSSGGQESSGSGTGSTTDTPQQRVLLDTDRDRIIESTLLRVRVDDIKAARQEALSLINRYGYPYEVITSGSRETIKITAKNDRLLQDLRALGEVIEEQEDTKDISGQYSEQVEQYRSLQARLDSAGSKEEKERLQAKMDTIEAQLEEWNRQAKTETVILWLQKA